MMLMKKIGLANMHYSLSAVHHSLSTVRSTALGAEQPYAGHGREQSAMPLEMLNIEIDPTM